MQINQPKRIGIWLLAVVLWIGAGVGFSRPIQADEPAEEFLQALLEQQLYDLAFSYLDQMENSQLPSDEFRSLIPLYRAEALIQSTAQSRDLKFWEEQLGKAETLLSKFASETRNATSAAKAQQTLANLRFRQARVYIKRGEQDRLTADEKQQAMTRARELLTESLKSFEQAREGMRVQIEQLTARAKDRPELADQLEPLRSSFTQLRLRLPMAQELLAETYPADSAEYKQNMEAAGKEFEELWDKYSRYAAGLEACLSAARCKSRIGKIDDALLLLEEVLNQSDSPAFRKIKRAAALIAVDCWRKREPYPFQEAITRLEPMVGSLTREEQRQEEWLLLQFALAEAYQAQAKDMQANNRSTGDVNRVKRSAATLLKVVSRNPSPVMDEARKLLGDSNLDVPDTEPEQPVSDAPPVSLADALAKAMDVSADVETAYQEVAEIERRINVAADSDKLSLEQELKQKRKSLDEQATRLRSTLKAGMDLAPADADLEQLNHIRYANFSTDRLMESALIGEFLLEKYPNVEWTRQANGLAVNAYARMFNSPNEKMKEYAKGRLKELADRLISRWPGSQEANSSAAMMTRLALADKNLPVAEEYFKAIGGDAPSRPALSLLIGQKKWEQYRADKAALSPEERVAKKAELEQKLQGARESLGEGVNATLPEEVTIDAAVSSLLLVNALLESGDVTAAVEQLENARIAPLDLIKQQNPVINNSKRGPAFVSETYRTAINVYLASLKTGNDSAAWITKAQNVLAALKQNLDSRQGINAAEEMTAIYGLIAAELRGQFESLTDPAQRMNLAKNLLMFLDPLKNSAGDAKTKMWVGATLVDTAKALQAGGPEGQALARELFTSAIESLDAAKSMGFEKDPKGEARLLEVGRLKATALAGSGKFEDAIKQYAAILEPRPGVLPIQIDAADTLQAWAKATNSAKTYEMAVMGTERRTDPKTKRAQNVIWGWRQLVLATRNSDEYKLDFYAALYRMSEARMEYGQLQKSKTSFETALKEIESARTRDPQMGGADWKAKFDELEKKLKGLAGN
jgi:hypothetical protein